MVFAVLNALLMLPLAHAGLSVPQRLVVTGAVVLIAADLVLVHARQRTFPGEPLVAGLLVFVFGLFMDSGSGLIGFAIGATISQTLYGSTRSVVTRNLATMIGITAAVLVDTGADGQAAITLDTPLPILLVVPALFAGLMRMMGSILQLLDQAGKREALLAEVGFQLSGLTAMSDVSAVLDRAAQDLCRLSPGLTVLVVRAGEPAVGTGPDSWSRTSSPVATRVFAVSGSSPMAVEPGQVVIEAAYGVPGAPIGLAFPLAWLPDVDPHRIGSARRCPGSSALEELVGHRRSGWLAMGTGSQDVEQYVLVAAPGRTVPEGVLDSMRTLSTQRALANANCQSHEELTHLAHHDQLTGTPNQRAFFGLLAAAIARASKPGPESTGPESTGHDLALLIIDLDDFKRVNDTLGHHCGDELLIQIAERLHLAAGPNGVVSRFGGDEYAVLLTELSTQDQADEIARRVVQQLQAPVQLSGGTVIVGGSVGLIGNTPGATAADLMRCADIAMYAAKEAGKNRVERFSDVQHGRVSQVRLLEEQLLYVVARDEIVLYYQPLIDLKTGQCAGAEALARWQHPDLGLLLPSDFMPVAERRGLMAELQTHILRSACRQLKAWNDLEPKNGLRISVNVSSRLLLTPGFDETIRDLLTDTGTPADRLSLEFSESEMLAQELPRRRLASIVATGIRIALDDAGTNNVSLANLRALKPSQLKIDCRPLNRADSSAAEMMNLVMSVSRFLKLETVAKMIETPDHLDRARDEGLTLGQGYYFGAPMPAEMFSAWLTESRTGRLPGGRPVDSAPPSSVSG